MSAATKFVLCLALLWASAAYAQTNISSSGGASVGQSSALSAQAILAPCSAPTNLQPVPLVGVLFSCQLALTGAGGIPPYNFGTVTGGFPTGLSMSTGVNGGLISGTATSTTSATATFPVTDSSSPAQVVTVTISYTPLAIVAGSVSISCPPQTVLASGALTCTSNGTFGAANFPGNVVTSLNILATFSCSGTCGSFPAAGVGGNVFTAGASAGTANLTATFQSVASTSTPVTVTTAGSPVVIGYPTSTLPNGQQYQPYPDSQVVGQSGVGQGIQILASGGTAPYTCSLSSGSLPAGLALSNIAGNTNCLISGSATTVASGSSFTIQVADSASHSSTVVISGGITVVALTSVTAPTFGSNPITPNAQTQATTTGAYSADSTTSPLVNALAALVMSGTGITNGSSNSASLQVPAIATQTGWALGGVAISWASAACSGTTMTITSANETFTSVATQIGQTGTPPPSANCIQSFLATNVTGAAADRPQCNFSPSNGNACYVFPISGVATSSLLDQSPANTSSILNTPTATACTPGSITTGQANTVVIAFCAPNSANGFTPPNGFLSQGNSYVNFYTQVLNSAQTVQPADSFSGGASNYVAGIFSIKANTPAAGGVVWSSGTPSCATISAAGLITALPQTTTCTTVITATVGAVTNNSTLTVQVTNADTSIIIVPNPSATVTVGGTQQYQAIGNVTGNTYQAQWGSSNTSVATINSSSGLATCAAVGSVSISAAVSGFSQVTPTALNCVSQAAGNSINASDCSQGALTTAWNSMIPGANTINLPSCASGGTGTYTTQFSSPVPSGVTDITIHGNTTITCSGTAGTSTYACTAVDNTVLTDQYNTQNSPMWNLNLGTVTSFRITGITFQGGTLASAHKPVGFIQFLGSTTGWRMDHNHFHETSYNCNGVHNCGGGVTMFGAFEGVADHNLVDQFTPNNWVRDYGSGGMGNNYWAQATQWGTQHFVFLELNVINGGFANDCNDGGRMVARYNSIYADSNDFTANSGTFQQHEWGQGTMTDGGCRATEAYHNFFHNPTPSHPTYSALDAPTGTSVQWDNTVDPGQSYVVEMQFAREAQANNCGGGGCGTPPSGIGYCGNASTGTGSPWDGNSIASTGYPCMHQTGRGQGQLLSGNTPNLLNTVTGTVSWPHELREPYYMWGNTGGDNTLYNVTTWNGVGPVFNRDFYSECTARDTFCTGAFNGTSGMGVGVLASRPATCTAGPGGTYDTSPTGSYGVGYFATDANSGQGELYVCTSTNTWTPIYQPYVFPHPLDH